MTEKLLSLSDPELQRVPVKLSTWRSWIHQGRIPVIHVGRRVFIRQSTLEEIVSKGLPETLHKKSVDLGNV